MMKSKEKLTREKAPKEGVAEKTSRFFRNVNALGALALGGIALAIPGPNIIIASWAGLNAAQAGGWELLRAKAEKARKKKDTKK
jgi:hypothetical protein